MSEKPKCRIVQVGVDAFIVQRKGWFFWNSVTYCDINGHYREFLFETEADAENHIRYNIGRPVIKEF